MSMRRSEEPMRFRWFGDEAKEAQVEMVFTCRKSKEVFDDGRREQ